MQIEHKKQAQIIKFSKKQIIVYRSNVRIKYRTI